MAVALLPLFVLMPMIGKYQDIAHSTLAASRYAAFDMLTRYQTTKPQSQLDQEVRQRFFSAANAPIKSSESAQSPQASLNPLWRDPTNRPLIAQLSDISIRHSGASLSDSSDPQGMATAALEKARGLIDLPQRELHTATVSVPLINLPQSLRIYEPFDRLHLRVQRHTSVVPDPWTAAGPAQVQAQIDKAVLIPLSRPLRAVGELIDLPLSAAEPGVSKPQLGELEFWSDLVPSDRLKASK